MKDGDSGGWYDKLSSHSGGSFITLVLQCAKRRREII